MLLPLGQAKRQPLSKKYATGDMSLEQRTLRPADWYDKLNVTLETGKAVTSANRTAKTISLSDGSALSWNKLVFATGSRARKLPDTVTKGQSNIHYLRTVANADALGVSVVAGKRVLIMGGGCRLRIKRNERDIGGSIRTHLTTC